MVLTIIACIVGGICQVIAPDFAYADRAACLRSAAMIVGTVKASAWPGATVRADMRCETK